MLPARRLAITTAALLVSGHGSVLLLGASAGAAAPEQSVGVYSRADVRDAASSGDVLPDAVVVQVDGSSLDAAAFEETVAQLGGSSEEVTELDSVVAGVRSVTVGEGRDLFDAMQLLEGVPGVRSVGPDVVYRASAIPTDPQFGRQWNLHNTGQAPPGGTPDADIDAPEGWDLSIGAPTTVVAVVDSGVQLDHPEFTGRIWANPEEAPGGTCVFDAADNDGNGLIDDCFGYDFVDGPGLGGGIPPPGGSNGPRDNDPSPCGSNLATPNIADCDGLDNNGDGLPDGLVAHGTHVAGIVAAAQNNSVGGFGMSGVAPNTALMPVRALTEDGFGSTTDVVAALNYAMTEGAKIINMSFGSDVYDPTFSLVVASAIAADVTLVAAAGNANENIIPGFECDSPVCNDDPSGSGANGVISVAATGELDRKASFSNFSTAGFVDIAAPGTGILSTCYDNGIALTFSCSTIVPTDVGVEPNEFSSMSGTSQASPHVAGAVALVRAALPGLNSSQAANALLFGGDDITAVNKNLFGCDPDGSGSMPAEDCTTSANGSIGTLGHSRLNVFGAFMPHLVGVTPSNGTRGTIIGVTIQGVGTAWSDASTVDFGQGIGVSNLSCSSPATCTATLNVTNAASLGPHDVSVTSGAEVTHLSGAFTVSNAVLRIAGANRIETAVETSKIAYPEGASADVVVLARRDTFPDSLAGTPLAGFADGPILFTGSNSLDPSTSAEIQRVLSHDADPEPDIYLLGGDQALSVAVEAAAGVLSPDWQVKRVGGKNRSETSLRVAEELHVLRGGPPTQVVVATQSNFPDALAAAVPAADSNVYGGRMPVLLTSATTLSQPVRDYLTAMGGAIQTAYVVGGTKAVDGDTFFEIDTLVGTTVRLAGPDRYRTAVAVDDQFYPKPISASFASGRNFPDALAGSYLSAKMHSPMMLINFDQTPQATTDYVTSHASSLLGGYMFGGTAVIPESVRAFLESII